MFGRRKKAEPPPEPVLLISVSGSFAAGQVRGLLEEAGIPFLTRERESGGYLKISAGSSPFGTDFYVRGSDLERARGCSTA